MILALYDISGIQGYIFQSNRMKENIGASRIVGDVLNNHLTEILRQLCSNDSNWRAITDWRGQSAFSYLKDSSVKLEVIYIGGGNALVAYRDVDDYNIVNEQLAMRVLEASRSLYLAVTSIESEGRNFAQDKELLERRMARVKMRMIPPRPPGAFPVSEQELHSGLPITDFSPIVQRNVSRLQRIKLEAIPKDEAKELIRFPSNTIGFQKWAFEMSELIQERDQNSFVAIVHIDGNGMGEQLRRRLREKKDISYSDAVQEMREMSKQISDGYKNVFYQIIMDLMEAHPTDFWVKETAHLPIRPLIMDGDDLTFVCLGAWGVPLAARLLELLEEKSQSNESEGLSLSACAGVALVHSHFPFHLGYEAAEACCRRAKKFRSEEGTGQAYLDFELVRHSHPKQLGQDRLRAGPYRISGDVFPDKSSPVIEGWSVDFSMLAACLNGIANSGWPNWRLEKLYSALHGEPEQLQFFLQECRSRGYRLEQLLPSAAEYIVTTDERELLLDALNLYSIFDWKVWTFGKEGAR